MYRSASLALLIVTGSPTLAADSDTYRYQLNLGYSDSEFDDTRRVTTDFNFPGFSSTRITNNNNTTDTISFDASWYFLEVEADARLLAEAAFLQRSSSLTLNYANDDNRVRTLNDTSFTGPIAFAQPQQVRDVFETETDRYGLGARYVFKDSGWIIELDYQREEHDFGLPASSGGGLQLLSGPAVGVDFDLFNVFSATDSRIPAGVVSVSAVPFESDSDNYGISVGKYLFANTALTLSYSRFAPESSFDSDTYGLEFKHVGPLYQDLYFSLEASISETELDERLAFSRFILNGNLVTRDLDDDSTTYAINTTLYPKPNLGFGLSYGETKRNSRVNTNYSVFLEWFVLKKLSVSAAYRNTDQDFVPATDIYSAELKWRI